MQCPFELFEFFVQFRIIHEFMQRFVLYLFDNDFIIIFPLDFTICNTYKFR